MENFFPASGLPVTQATDLHGELKTVKADVVVVGSGAGGAVAAYELAKEGKKVVILEAGPYVPSSEFSEKLGDMMGRLYQDQGAQPTYPYGDAVIGQGACVGGSTVVNACISFRTPDEVLLEWGQKFGLTNLSPKTLRPIFDEVEKNLNIHKNEAHEINECAEQVIRGCEKLGYSWGPVSRNVKQCALTGHCLAGCSSDRKMSMLVSYLPWAIAEGAELYSDAWVRKVRIHNGRAVGVEATVRDPNTGKVTADLSVQAPVVVLAAGAIQTPLIMKRSGIRNKNIGKNLSLHPFVSVLGQFEKPVYGWRGALTGIHVDHFLKGKKILLESGLAEPEQLIAQGTQNAGREHLAFMKNYKYMSAMNCFIHDNGHGEVSWDGSEFKGNKRISWRLSKEDFENFKEAVRLAGRIYFAAGAKKVYLPTYKQLVAENQEELELILQRDVKYGLPNGVPDGLYSFRTLSVHPQGTARMGADRKHSAVNPYGESHDVNGLFVTDSSVFPSEVTVNPQTSIYAMSAYISRQILSRRGNYFTS